MIAFVNGIVEDYSEEAVILDVNGIGYEIKISGDTAAALPSIGERMKRVRSGELLCLKASRGSKGVSAICRIPGSS